MLGAETVRLPWVVALVVVGSLIGSPATAQSFLVLPFGSCGWEYANPATSEDRAALSQGDNGGFQWRSPICAPFVRSWGCDTTGVTFYENINPGESSFIFRRHIVSQLDHAVTAYVTVRVRGFIDIWCNGLEAVNANNGNQCPVNVFSGSYDSFTLEPGDNIIAMFHNAAGPEVPPAISLGGELDVQITATEMVTPARGTTWGHLKLIYR